MAIVACEKISGDRASSRKTKVTLAGSGRVGAFFAEVMDESTAGRGMWNVEGS